MIFKVFILLGLFFSYVLSQDVLQNSLQDSSQNLEKNLTLDLEQDLFEEELKKQYILNVPLPSNNIISLFQNNCDEFCLEKLLDDGQIFSFLSLYKRAIVNSHYLRREYEKYNFIFRVNQNKKIFINVIFPSSAIGNYVNSITDTIIAYLSFRFIDFELNFIDIKTETKENIEKAINDISFSRHYNTIAILRDNAIEDLLQSNHNKVNLFLPTINSKDLNLEEREDNIYFAGISYKNQIDKIKSLLDINKTTIFDEDNLVSKKLTSMFSENLDINYTKTISKNQTRFKSTIKTKKIDDSFVVFNTSLVKTGILLSNINYYDKNIYKAYSTQINYNPVILHLTQSKAREKFYILNSIMNINPFLNELNSINNADIAYDWVLYTTTVSLDYMLEKFYSIPRTMENISLENNNFQYEIEIIAPLLNKFIKIEE